MYSCNNYPVIEKNEIASGIFSYTILCPEVAAEAKPGQFVHIRVEGFTLRRPISISDIDKKKGTIRIIFEVRGKGTLKMTTTSVGEEIDMIAPLGNGFTLPEQLPEGKKIAVIGGGIGVPPLYAVAKQYGEKASVILGFRSHDKIILKSDFSALGANVAICTDDGSYGVKGLVTLPLVEQLEKGEIAGIFACGPTPMLKAIVNAAKLYNVPCQVSLEQRMGCGVGACVGCACTIRKNGRDFTLRVCKDGPVFNGEEVVF